jgi:hypothetical protein
MPHETSSPSKTNKSPIGQPRGTALPMKEDLPTLRPAGNPSTKSIFNANFVASNVLPSSSTAVPRPNSSYNPNRPPTLFSSSEELYHQLPERIEVINESRQVVGAKEFTEYRRRNKNAPPILTPPGPQPHPSENSTCLSLSQEIPDHNSRLEEIFQTLNSLSPEMLDERQIEIEISTWIKELRFYVNHLSASSPLSDKSGRKEIVTELVRLLINLNALLEECDDNAKGFFYHASRQRIDQVFGQLGGLSTHCEKEIEEFMDEREDWENQHGYTQGMDNLSG